MPGREQGHHRGAKKYEGGRREGGKKKGRKKDIKKKKIKERNSQTSKDPAVRRVRLPLARDPE